MAPLASPYSKRSLADWVSDLQNSVVPDDRYRALLAVNALGALADVVHWSTASLNDADSQLRALGAKQIGELQRANSGSALVDWATTSQKLAKCLHDPDPDVRFEVARALVRIDAANISARDVLLSQLDDEGIQPLMIATVVSALAECNPIADAVIERYRTLLSHPQAEIRENVSAAIVRMDSETAKLAIELIAALNDDEPIVRENAAIALGLSKSPSPQLLESLRAAISDEDEGVAKAAQAALYRLGDSRSE